MARRQQRADRLGPDDTGLPVVSLIGRPNVGKSSLFNRLVGGRPALVEDEPGVTRDRRYGLCEWEGVRFRIVDTGGLDPSAAGILGAMRTQTLRAVDEADVLVLVIDAKEGLTPLDEDCARVLRRTGKPVLLAANKIDSAGRESHMGDVFKLGFDSVYPLSASHGRGVRELLDDLGRRLRSRTSRETPSDEPAAQPIRLAFVGKPNVGKSSLVNRLLGEERVLVHDQPGTTRDPIDTPFRVGERDFVLVDTAGIRRRRMVNTQTEAVSAMMSRDQLERADVGVLVIDAQEGATAEDAKLASLIEESGRAAIIVLNKSDLVPRAKLDERLVATREQLKFMLWAPLIVTSAMTGRAVREIPDEAAGAFAQWSRRIPTSDLNRNFEAMVNRRPPASGPAGRHVRLYYITQPSVRPPTFYVSTNLPKQIGEPYRRYLLNQLRQVYGFGGSPLKIVMRAKKKKGEVAE